MNVRLFRPYLDEQDLDSIKVAFDANWLGLGSRVGEFEAAWREKFQVNQALGLNSATAALHLALEAFRFPAGKKVLVPSMTFSSTAMAVMYTRLEPVFVDCEPENLTMDVEDLERKMDKDCVAIIPVHYGGSACDMERIMELAAKNDLKVIEDCAHTQGGTFRGKILGTIGDIGCFSFEEKKGMTTGDGGMLVCDDQEIYNYLKPMRWVGIDKDTWKRASEVEGLEDRSMHWFYEIRNLGFKYNMNNLAASLGLSQLAKLDDINATKNAAIKRYIDNLGNLPGIEFLMDYSEKSWTGSYWLFGLRLRNRPDFINYVIDKGVSTGVHFTPLNEQPYWSGFKGETPISSKVYQQIVTLPLFPMMDLKEVDYVSGVIADYFKKG